MRTHFSIVAALFIVTGFTTVAAAVANDDGELRVTLDNFRRAETDMYFAKFVKEGALGRFMHEREMTPIDKQGVIRMNRDTLYSWAVFDLDAGPVTVILPDPGERFMAMQIIDEDHYTPQVIYTPGPHSFQRDKSDTRYIAALIRTFANPNEPADMQKVHSLQDAVRVEQASPGKFEVPAWDQQSLTKMRNAINALSEASGGLNSARMFGAKDQVDPVQHLVGTAAGWGGNPREDALYVGDAPEHNDGKTPYTLTVKDVPVDGFWSVSVYNKDGFFEKNAKNAYTLNNVTATPSADGSVTIRFGGDENAENMLPITPGWNYLVRLYRPRKEILDSTWKFPEAVPTQ